MIGFREMELQAPIMPIVLFIGVAFIIPLLWGRAKKYAWVFALAAHIGALYFVRVLDINVQRFGVILYALGGWDSPWGIEFVVNGFSIVVLYILLIVSACIVLYSGPELKKTLKEEVIPWYYNLYLLLIMSMMGLAVSNDLFNIFVFMEIGTIGSCGIISLKRGAECIESSLKYLLLSSIGTSFVLMATAMIYNVSGHLNISIASQQLEMQAATYPVSISVAAVFFSIGFFIKAALFPVHIWLPDAHTAAPFPSSGVLSGLVIKIYAVTFVKLLRYLFPASIMAVLPIKTVIIVLSCASMIFGSLLALRQTNIKRLLSYSSVAQIGLVFLGIGIYNQIGLSGSLYQIGAHAVAKALLFLSVGIFFHRAGVKNKEDVAGLWQRFPLAAAAFVVGGLTMIGLPTTGGFITKLYLSLGALGDGQPLIVLIILLSTVLTGLYFLPMITSILFGKAKEIEVQGEGFIIMEIAIALLLVLSVAAGLAPNLFAKLLKMGVQALL